MLLKIFEILLENTYTNYIIISNIFLIEFESVVGFWTYKQC